MVLSNDDVGIGEGSEVHKYVCVRLRALAYATGSALGRDGGRAKLGWAGVYLDYVYVGDGGGKFLDAGCCICVGHVQVMVW